MKRKIFILIIILTTILTRFFDLQNIPGFLGNDEVAIAYNAFSIADTGQDEYGISWPITFKSFNDYKAPGYIYLLAPLTKILPQNKLTVKLPSAISGSLTVLFAGLLFFELTNNFWISSTSAFLIAITPWHIALSRMAMETNLALLFLTLGMWLWLKNRHYLSAIVLALSLYSYHTEKLFVPLFMFIVQWKTWLKQYRFWLLFTIILLPIGVNYYQQYISGVPQDSKWFWVEASAQNTLSDKNVSFVPKVAVVFRTFISKYGAYLNPGYLFIDGLTLFSNRGPIPTGLFLLPEVVFMIIGLTKLKKFILKQYLTLVIWWLVILQVVPALTIGGPNLNRHLIAVVPLSFLAGIGLYWILLTSHRLTKIISVGSVIVTFSFFLLIYFGLYKIESKENFQWGYEQIAISIKNKYYDSYDKIIIDRRFGDTNRYIGAPNLFLGYFSAPKPLTKFKITEINWNLEKTPGRVLYVTPKDNLPPKNRYKTIENIDLSNGATEFKIIELLY